MKNRVGNIHSKTGMKRLILGILLFFSLSPILLLAIKSLSSQWNWPQLLPQNFNNHSLNEVLRDREEILKSLLIAGSYSLMSAFLSFLICYSSAATLVRAPIKQRYLIQTIFMAPVMVPAIAFSLGIHQALLSIGLIDSWWGVSIILTAFSYPYMLHALIGGFTNLGEEYDLAAENLGASHITRMLSIELPLILPSVLTGASVVFLIAFSDYYLLFLIGGGLVQGYTGYLFPFLKGSDFSMGAILSLLFLILPLLLFSLVVLKIKRWYEKKGMHFS